MQSRQGVSAASIASKQEFTQAAVSAEGSGWAALAFCLQTNRPLVKQIEKHNVNIYPKLQGS